jgi:RHS repeat-associated protein
MESTQPVLRCVYSYDPLDRLISQLQPDAPSHQRFYCKSRLATEIQGAIGFSVFQNNDLLLAQCKKQGGAVESTLLATDPQRSVLHTLTADQQQHPIAYSPYGHRQAESGLTSLLGFNGERPDPVTGCYLLGNGYRGFNPVLMRFNSPDSWSPFGKGGLNAYAYCLGDPVNHVDPTGHAFLHWLRSTASRLSRPLRGISPSRRTAPILSVPTTSTATLTDALPPRTAGSSRATTPRSSTTSYESLPSVVSESTARSQTSSVISLTDQPTRPDSPQTKVFEPNSLQQLSQATISDNISLYRNLPKELIYVMQRPIEFVPPSGPIPSIAAHTHTRLKQEIQWVRATLKPTNNNL